MSAATGFWNQPSTPYRNFQIVFTVLTLNFAVPAFVYTFTPTMAVESILQVNQLMGGGTYPFDETSSELWRILAAANVAVLAFMCLLLQLDLRKWYAVLAPLCFLKAYAALGLAGIYLLHTDVPFFLAGTLLDGVTLAVIYTFSTRAHADIVARPVEELVPRPRWAGP